MHGLGAHLAIIKVKIGDDGVGNAVQRADALKCISCGGCYRHIASPFLQQACHSLGAREVVLNQEDLRSLHASESVVNAAWLADLGFVRSVRAWNSHRKHRAFAEARYEPDFVS